jgi:dihydrolipoamide dehydrogenase
MAEAGSSDLLVLGAGPGGYAAAFHAADKGMQVTLVDAREKPGGACLYVGCIPSKALLHVAKIISEAKDVGHWGVQYGSPKIEIDKLRAQGTKVVETLGKNLAELCKRRKVEYLRGQATFVDRETIQLQDGTRRRFKHGLIATGSSPAQPPSLQLASPRVMDSTAALRLEEVPETLLVVGGGYIGLELGTVYAGLGCRVTVVELTDGLLPGVDRDLVRPLQSRLESLFHKIHLSTKVTQIAEIKKGLQVTLEGAEVPAEAQVFDRALIAVGRRPNSRDLGLENTRVELDDKGFIRIDEQRRTTEPSLFAIGDVAGEPMLAHKAHHEGKIAVEVIAGEPAAFDSRAIPAVVFTDPEIAWCGLTETEAKRQKREIKVLRFPWAASGRALTLGRTEGLTKLLVEPETERILGVGLVGYGAGEMIAEGVLAVEMAATARDLALSIHPHPTLTETISEAAESLYGPTTHIYKPKR